jgi:hypothetical protein
MEVADPRLRALAVAGVRPDHLLRQAEAWGLDPRDLVPLARKVLRPHMKEDPACAAACLALGVAEAWQALVPQARGAFLEVIPAMRGTWGGGLEVLESWFDPYGWDAFRLRVLHRLGYPVSLLGLTGPEAAASSDVTAWLDEGMFVLEPTLELKGFSSSAPTWEIQTWDLRLAEGHGPGWIFLNPNPVVTGSGVMDAVTMRGVTGTQGIKGIWEQSQVVLLDCPDLAWIQGAPGVLVVRNCPSLELVCLPSRCGLVHLQNCPRLRTLDVATDLDWDFLSMSVRELVVDACPWLSLPDVLRVERTMRIRRQDGRFRWPRDLWIGGDLRIQACPGLLALPAFEVGGSLRVTGASGLRSLGSGLVIGGDLDLRACRHLEGLPSGLRVGGRILLPPHLEARGSREVCPSVPWFQEEGEIKPEHLEGDLRTLLIATAFAEQAAPEDRVGLRLDAGRIIRSLSARAGASLAAESAILYTASVIWDELAQVRWEADKPYERWSEEIPELPVAWFRALLFDESRAHGGAPYASGSCLAQPCPSSRRVMSGLPESVNHRGPHST